MPEKPVSQSDKFKQAARDLGCDESEEAFDEKLRAIAKQKPKDANPKVRPPRRG